jgi:CDGSH-type Zn-finger protein
MLAAVTLPKIGTELNTSRQQVILSSNHMNLAKIGNGVM